MLETLDYTIRIGSAPTFLYFDLYLYSAYAAQYVYYLYRVHWGPLQPVSSRINLKYSRRRSLRPLGCDRPNANTNGKYLFPSNLAYPGSFLRSLLSAWKKGWTQRTLVSIYEIEVTSFILHFFFFFELGLVFVMKFVDKMTSRQFDSWKQIVRGQLYKTLNYDLTSHRVVNT